MTPHDVEFGLDVYADWVSLTPTRDRVRTPRAIMRRTEMSLDLTGVDAQGLLDFRTAVAVLLSLLGPLNFDVKSVYLDCGVWDSQMTMDTSTFLKWMFPPHNMTLHDAAGVLAKCRAGTPDRQLDHLDPDPLDPDPDMDPDPLDPEARSFGAPVPPGGYLHHGRRLATSIFNAANARALPGVRGGTMASVVKFLYDVPEERRAAVKKSLARRARFYIKVNPVATHDDVMSSALEHEAAAESAHHRGSYSALGGRSRPSGRPARSRSSRSAARRSSKTGGVKGRRTK
jgi:hypothetical protein